MDLNLLTHTVLDWRQTQTGTRASFSLIYKHHICDMCVITMTRALDMFFCAEEKKTENLQTSNSLIL